MITKAGVDVGKEGHLLLVGVQTGSATMEINGRFLRKMELDLLHDPAPSLWSYTPETTAHPYSLLL